jgi:hypothetical protein
MTKHKNKHPILKYDCGKNSILIITHEIVDILIEE